MVTASTDTQRQRDDLTTRRLQAFEQRYGSLALDLACHAAFPLALTPDLVYCLRENFVRECPWYAAADVLLSGLCSPIGYDLYEIEGLTRDLLLRRLCQEFGEDRLYQLEDFMVAYIGHRLQVEPRARVLSLGDRPHWTALACLRSDEAVRAIEQELRRVIAGSDPRERLRLAYLVERTADLLAESKFRPLLLDWANRTAQGEPIDAVAAAAIAATQSGILLKTLEFETVTLVFDDATNDPSDDELKPFEFETVTVDRRGREIRRESKQPFFFVEPVSQEAAPLEMVAIPSGSFLMGSPETESERYDDESPQHEVTVQSFFLSKYPITQAQWREVARLPQVNRELDPDPSGFKGDRLPVESVSWQRAVEFCDRLSAVTGRTYRLPTEAEWEYACRAGTTTPFHLGETITTHLANYDGSVYQQESKGQDRKQTTNVGSFPPNAFGLYDMHGNVWEWCLDHWHENYDGAPTDGSAWLDQSVLLTETRERITTESSDSLTAEDEGESHVIRGGSWYFNPGYCRSAYRGGYHPDLRYLNIGFRVVCVVPRTL